MRLRLTECIKYTVESKNFTCRTFIDLQKLLILSVTRFSSTISNTMVYRALAWLCFYLSNRCQYVSVNGHNSSYLKITFGAPQVSVLDPLLFIIYINDLPTSSSKLSFYLFADKTIIYFESDNFGKLDKMVNKELKKAIKWLDTNKPALNITKTCVIIFHSLQNAVNIKLR